MELLKNPLIFYELMNNMNLNDKIYEAMGKNEFTEAVLCVLNLLRNSNKFPKLNIDGKSVTKSDVWRDKGNTAFTEKKYHQAQECYNKALLTAPMHSEALVLAYSNRSLLFHKVGCFEACLNDINTCLNLSCPRRIVLKLNKKKKEVESDAFKEKLAKVLRHKVLQEYITVKNKNTVIPCATTDIEAVVDDDSTLPKLITTKNVKVGTVLAIEKAFVGILSPAQLSTSCYYCHKVNLNLIPCDYCCVALFCNENCKTACMNDYHSTECKVMEILDILETQVRLALKAAIKVKNQFKSWDKLNKESHLLGTKRIKRSKMNEIYDVENNFSMLNFKNDGVFIYGQFHNIIYECALITYYLDQTNSFFPLNFQENHAAICSFSRLLIYFTMHMTNSILKDQISLPLINRTTINDSVNSGAFALTGKIKHSCNPNVLAVSCNNRVMLVAIQPLEARTELTISYLGHRLDDNDMTCADWKYWLFSRINHVCNIDCGVCNDKQSETILTDKHRRVMRMFEELEMKAFRDSDHLRERFLKCALALSIMSDVPYTKEYKRVFTLFRQFFILIQEAYCSNETLRMPD